MSNNIWAKFQQLNTKSPLLVVRIEQVLTEEGTSLVRTAGGGQMRALGAQLEVGSAAFVQDGRILAAAPDLPHYDLTV